jgi:hypothetical protein
VIDERICEGCGNPLPPEVRRNARYHGGACRTAAWRTRVAQAAPVEGEDTKGIATHALADALTASVGRTAWALATGGPAAPVDAGRLRVISHALAARAMAAHPEVDWSDGDSRVTMAIAPSDPSRDGEASGGPAQAAAAPASATKEVKPSRDGSGEEEGMAPQSVPVRSEKPRRMSRKQALAVMDAAALERAEDWRESSRWVLRSGETVIGVLTPDYSGLKRSGWIGVVHETSVRTERRPTREAAMVALADAWLRQVTAKPRHHHRTLNDSPEPPAEPGRCRGGRSQATMAVPEEVEK